VKDNKRRELSLLAGALIFSLEILIILRFIEPFFFQTSVFNTVIPFKPTFLLLKIEKEAYKVVLLSVYSCPLIFLGLWGLRDHLAVCPCISPPSFY
jgi:hypothetical protein